MTQALNSLNEDHWFKKMKVDDPDRRQKLVDAIKKHCFLGGCPLPPNLSLTALSVKQAASALGTNVPLATIDLRAFEAHFLTDYESQNVLAPM